MTSSEDTIDSSHYSPHECPRHKCPFEKPSDHYNLPNNEPVAATSHARDIPLPALSTRINIANHTSMTSSEDTIDSSHYSPHECPRHKCPFEKPSDQTYTSMTNSQETIPHECPHHKCPFGKPPQKVNAERTNNQQTLVGIIGCASLLDGEPNSLMTRRSGSITSLYNSVHIKQEPTSETFLHGYNPFQDICYAYANPEDSIMCNINGLWKRTAHVSSEGLPVTQLELLYDIISACITLNRCNLDELIPALERTLTNFENSNLKTTSQGQFMDRRIE